MTLQRRYEILAQQYEDLLKNYNHVLRLAKENSDCYEYCLQDLEKEIKELKIKYEGKSNE